MYQITCDGYSLLDTRDESLIVGSPNVKLSDNTVGEASFTIYTKHPYYDKLVMHKSRFEISDEFGVIFRGRMTEHTRDIKKGKAVDLEGAMAYFNDSIVRPYTFPEGFLEEEGYIAAAKNGNVIEYYLAWLIEQHNAQVDEFQRFKLGTVTVTDPNNYLSRANSEYPNTFEEIKSKLFDSALGGHLCIRYEADGNYIDYLAEYTEKNAQGIVYGENLRSVSEVTDGKDTYSAVIPRGMQIGSETSGGSTGQLRLTIVDLPDGDIDADIVKKGDMLYSKSAVAAYGWRYAPAADTTWDDVTLDTNLRRKGAEFLKGEVTKIPKTIECKAVDLHCTDAEIRSFRIYKKIPVYIQPHGIDADFDITTLDIDLLNPQNTNIAVGKTIITMTAIQDKQTSEVKQLAEKLGDTNKSVSEIKFTTEKNQADISLVVSDGKANGSLIIEAINGEAAAKISADRLDIEGKTLDIRVDATNIYGDLDVGGLLNVDIDNETVEIGGFTVAEDSLYTGEKTAFDDDNAGVHIGADGIGLGAGAFKVTPEGELHAENAHISGEVNATSGAIGGLLISSSNMSSGNDGVTLTDDGLIVAQNLEVRDYFQSETLQISKVRGRVEGNAVLHFEGATKNAQKITVKSISWEDYYVGIPHENLAYLVVEMSEAVPSSVTVAVTFSNSSDTKRTYNVVVPAGEKIAKQLENKHLKTLVSYTPNAFYFETGESTSAILCEGNFSPYEDDARDLGAAGTRWNDIWATNGTIQTSDRDKKNTIAPLTDTHSEIFDRLAPVSFKFNNNTSDRLHLGLIAQDVKQALDDLGVNSKDFAAYCEWENEDGTTGCGLRYTELIAMTIFEIQKLKAKIKELEERK